MDGFEPASAGTNPIFAWSVSGSETDPFDNTGVPTGALDTLYLWLYCSDPVLAAEMTLAVDPPESILGFEPVNGFRNFGDLTHLLLTVAGCPTPPLIAGNIFVLHTVPVKICLEGANVTVDCVNDPPLAWPHDRLGYADAGLSVCQSDTPNPCGPVSIGTETWGKIKSLYK
jgi:hypothetical protein